MAIHLQNWAESFFVMPSLYQRTINVEVIFT